MLLCCSSPALHVKIVARHQPPNKICPSTQMSSMSVGISWLDIKHFALSMSAEEWEDWRADTLRYHGSQRGLTLLLQQADNIRREQLTTNSHITALALPPLNNQSPPSTPASGSSFQPNKRHASELAVNASRSAHASPSPVINRHFAAPPLPKPSPSPAADSAQPADIVNDNNGRSWQADELQTLTQLARRNASCAEMCTRLGRRSKAIRKQLRLLGYSVSNAWWTGQKGSILIRTDEETYASCPCQSVSASPQVLCEECQTRFHSHCLELTDEQASSIEQYTCPPCCFNLEQDYMFHHIPALFRAAKQLAHPAHKPEPAATLSHRAHLTHLAALDLKDIASFDGLSEEDSEEPAAADDASSEVYERAADLQLLAKHAQPSPSSTSHRVTAQQDTARNNKQQWRAEQIELLQKGYLQRMDCATLCHQLGRSQRSVADKLRHLGHSVSKAWLTAGDRTTASRVQAATRLPRQPIDASSRNTSAAHIRTLAPATVLPTSTATVIGTSAGNDSSKNEDVNKSNEGQLHASTATADKMPASAAKLDSPSAQPTGANREASNSSSSTDVDLVHFDSDVATLDNYILTLVAQRLRGLFYGMYGAAMEHAADTQRDQTPVNRSAVRGEVIARMEQLLPSWNPFAEWYGAVSDLHAHIHLPHLTHSMLLQRWAELIQLSVDELTTNGVPKQLITIVDALKSNDARSLLQLIRVSDGGNAEQHHAHDSTAAADSGTQNLQARAAPIEVLD